jgi:hypothetical protein
MKKTCTTKYLRNACYLHEIISEIHEKCMFCYKSDSSISHDQGTPEG